MRRTAAAVVVAGMWAALAPVTAAASAWSTEPVLAPPGATASALDSVSCASAQHCVAVGYYDAGHGALPLAESRDPAGWQIDPVPIPAGAKPVLLHDVSCVTVSDCTAVGVSNDPQTNMNSTLAEHWDGTTWTIESTPNPSTANQSDLDGVSCSDRSHCMAVGTYDAPAGEFTFAERWNGAKWTIAPTYSSPGSMANKLLKVSCVDPGDCIAVGFYSKVLTPTTWLPMVALAEHWNGSTWQPQSIGSLPTDGISQFNDVSCETASDCMAVGFYDPDGWPGSFASFAERWDGSSWQLTPTPNPPGFDQITLSGVSCVTASNCSAVGDAFGNGGPLAADTLAEVWDGSSWQIQPTPNPGNSTLAGFWSVSCLNARGCVAVGQAGMGVDGLQAAGGGNQVDVAPTSGTVLIAPRGSGHGHFLPLAREREIPLGSLVDARHGHVTLTTLTKNAGTGDFSGGIFRILRNRVAGAITVLRLAGGSFAGCTTHKHSRIRSLKSSAHGRLRVKGRYSSSTPMNAARWQTIDACDGTLTTVRHGSVLVRDLRRHKTVTVTAGHSYLAKAA